MSGGANEPATGTSSAETLASAARYRSGKSVPPIAITKKDLNAGDTARKSITSWHSRAMWLQLIGLFGGMACITVYCIANL